MTKQAQPPKEAPASTPGGNAAQKRLRKRQAAERRFRLYGQAAISIAVIFLAVLVISIAQRAAPAFSRHMLVLDIPLERDVLLPNGPSDTELIAENVTGFNTLVQQQLRAAFPRAAEDRLVRRDLYGLTTRLSVLPMAEQVADNPDLIGASHFFRIAVSDDLDLYLKGGITERLDFTAGRAGRLSLREDGLYSLSDAEPDGFPDLRARLAQPELSAASTLINLNDTWYRLEALSGAVMELRYLGGDEPTLGEQGGGVISAMNLLQPEANRTLSDHQIAWAHLLEERGQIEKRFNWSLLTNADSTYPELAGAAAAIVGSILTMLVTALFAIPVGILAAVYLEEFAPKTRLTSLIEVNINNLAAVPSIIFGLLGAAVFLNTFGMPRSIPLVGGLVLGLLVLPTVIIASRAALSAIPPSVRTAALGLGASRTQAVFDHVLPLATPGILTGSIIAMARALGETAPLLLIGMVAFVNEIPTGPDQEATVLPVLIYKWYSGAERAWEPMTSAVIIILLLILIVMNLIAVLVRRRFERRW